MRGKLLREPQWRCLLHQGMLAAAGQHLMKESQAQGEHTQVELLRMQQSSLQLSIHCLAARSRPVHIHRPGAAGIITAEGSIRGRQLS